MKLLTRTSLYFVGITLLVFSLGGIVFYHTLRSVTSADVDERLQDGKNKVLSYVKIHGALPQNSISFGDTLSVSVASAISPDKVIKDTILYNASEKEREPYRMIRFLVNAGNVNYNVTICKPLIESDDLSHGILESIAIIASLLLVVLIVSNIVVTKNAWKPFYSTLEKIKSFDLAKEGSILFDSTKTSEFAALNNVLKSMTDKISTDYRNLKEFTENASHELQTPLSVIQSKIELLIQSQNLEAEQAENVKAIYESATKLSKLNQALLLLAKIENHQFAEAKVIAVDELITRKLEHFEELIIHKKIAVEKHLEHLEIKTHPILADVLLTNLINNAIKHNQVGGKLYIETSERKLIVRNSGDALSVPAESIFERFKKSNQASDSLGLGLAIVKEICNVYGYSIQYGYQDNMHTITVAFS
jgi:signal transduction histidine kinase